ncbi:MAG: hypothetical protein R3195_13980 [Gemmatimonadota bacterium]|nr:hypothetical protein [Gemmatimonadota bacterium]
MIRKIERFGGAMPAVLAAAGLCACGGGDGAGAASGEWSGTMRDSAGVVLVQNPEAGLWEPGGAWTVSEVLRIGTSGADADYQFGQITGIAELADGRIAVFDTQGQEMRLYSAAGEYLQTIGGPGSGPGEFALGAGPILVGPGDTLVVPDVSNQRVNRFAPDGEPLGSFPLNFAAGIPMAWLDTPGGDIVTQIRAMAFPGQAFGGQAAGADRELEGAGNDFLVRRRTDGSIIDTALVVKSGGTFQAADGGGSIEFFAPEPLWALLPDGVIYGVNDDYRFFVYGADGELERVISRPFELQPVAADDQQYLIDAMSRVWEDFGVPPPAIAQLRETIGFAETYPAYALLRGGPDGSIWVQRLRDLGGMSAEEREEFNPMVGFGSPTWDVFDAEGRYMGRVEMPDRFQPIRFQDDRIYGIWTDDLDVQYALILEVERV